MKYKTDTTMKTIVFCIYKNSIDRIITEFWNFFKIVISI